MEAGGLVIVAVLIFGYAMVSRRLSTTPITGPILFATAGVVLGPLLLGVIEADLEDEAIKLLLEVTLALVLFNDATEVLPPVLRAELPIAGRLLGIGLPLTMFLGVVAAALILTDLSLPEAAIVGVLLAPTDAALGQAVVSNERVPARIRQALNIESGLNDGLAVPVFGLAIAAAEAELEGSASILVQFAVDLALAVALGAAIGFIGARLSLYATERGWISTAWRAVAPAALALCCFASADWLGASGFIAAFVGGVAFGSQIRGRFTEAAVFSDGAAHLLTMLSFFVFGAAILTPVIEEIEVAVVVYAMLSLTLIRIVPVVIALAGSRLGWQTVSYLAWFGPRGLASIVFAAIVVIDTDLPGADTIVMAMAVTVAASILVHGATAWAGSDAYGNWWQEKSSREPDMTESVPVRTPVRRIRMES
ncbi:MAG: hypothetical protein EHM57_00910 [Actinobacteria bacterium]|nr:MAG: hypothetical protein EHM57_00910 [Actinomycetota bacterium]